MIIKLNISLIFKYTINYLISSVSIMTENFMFLLMIGFR